MKNLLSALLALLVLGGWMSMVGNPHVIETVIGLVFAVVTFFYVRTQFSKLQNRFGKQASIKSIVICPECNKKSSVPAGKQLLVTCPNCKRKYEVST
jgi:hypothetical protein